MSVMSYQADLVFLELQHGNPSQLILVYGSFHLYVYMIKNRWINLLRATRGAGNPNLQVGITHASHVCSQQWFGLPLRLSRMHRTYLITRVWSFYHS